MSTESSSSHPHTATQRALDEFHKLLPLFEEAGYKLETLALDLGVAPKLVPRFARIGDVSPERQAELLEAHRHHRLAHGILKGLLHANEAQRVLKVGSLSPSVMEISIGILPKVRLIWS